MESFSVHNLLSFKSDDDDGILLCSSFVVLQKWLRWRNLTLFIVCYPSEVIAMKVSYSVHRLLSFKSDQYEEILLCSSFVVLQKWPRCRNLTLFIICCPSKMTTMKEFYFIHRFLSFKSDHDEEILHLFIVCCPSKVTAMEEFYSVHHLLSFKSDRDEGILLCSSFYVLQKWPR